MVMRKKYIIMAVSILAIFFVMTGCSTSPSSQKSQIITNIAMKLSSTEFQPKGIMPAMYTCSGDDVNPPLEISDVPKEAKSLALIVDDPDAPAGDWIHWILWNISPDTKKILEKSVPDGAVEGKTSWGNNKWQGPCPPTGTHHYQFKLYALDKVIDLPASSGKSDLLTEMEGHTLDSVMLVGLARR